MKIFAIACSLLFSLSSSAAVFNYRLYDDSLKKFMPIVFSIDLNGPFKQGTPVNSVSLNFQNGTQLQRLFYWDATSIAKTFKITWNGNLLVIENGPKMPNFKAAVKSEFSNYWGDTSINKSDKYNISISKPMGFTEGAVTPGAYFDISNQTQEESCLQGTLYK